MIDDVRPAHRQPRAAALVAAGGALGGLARYAVATLLPGAGAVATLVVNVVGAFVLGMLLEALTRSGEHLSTQRTVRLLLGTGFCGAFTTYSTFAHDVVTTGGGPAHAALWAAAQVLGGVFAAAAGAGAAAVLTRRGR